MRFFLDHIQTESGDEVKIELIQVGSEASFQKLKGNRERGFFKFDHEKIDIEDPYSNPIQKGSLEVHFWIQNSTQLSFVKSVLEAQEGDFRAIYYIDDDPVWIGNILPDLSEYDEMSFDRQSASLYAKDVSILEGITYSALPQRQHIIDTIEDILDELNFDLDKITATSWSEDNITEAQDYLRQIYHERSILQTFGRAGGEPDETISSLEALEQVLRSNCLILKQWEGWRLDQITAYDDPESVTIATYDDGLDSESVEDRRLIFDRDDQRIVIGSVNRGIPGLKSARVRFDHRTTVQNLKFDPVVTFDGVGEQTQTQFFNSDGSQRLQLTGEVEAFAQEPTPPSTDFATQVTAEITIELDGNYWDGSTWDDSFASVFVSLSNPGGNRWVTNFSILTDETPVAAGDLNITIRNAETDQDPTGGFNIPTTTTYRGVEFEVLNPSIEEGQNTAIDYRLIQAQTFSVRYNHGETWFGNGPTSYALSRLTTDEAGENLTALTWGRRGQDLELDYHHNLLKEILDVQRGFRRNLSAIVKGAFDPSLVTVYDSANLFYLGGSQDGITGTWSVEFIEIDVETSETDTFEQIFRTTADVATGSIPPGGVGGGLTQPVADARYLLKSLNLSDLTNAATARGNLGLTNASAVLNLAALDIDGEDFVDGDRDVTARDVTGRDATFTGPLSADTIRPDTGKFLSPVDYQFRNAGDSAFRTISIAQATATDHAVAAGRTLTFGGDDAISFDESAQNLTANRTWNASIESHGDGQRGTIDPGTQQIYGDKLFHDDIGSPDWVDRLTGWQIFGPGNGDFRRLTTDEFITRSFISDTTLSLAGTDFLTKSNATLAEDVTFSDDGTAYQFENGDVRLFENGDVYLFENTAYDITVEEHEGLPGFNVFEHNDYVRIRARDSFGGSGLRIINIWGRVLFPDPEDSTSPDNEDGTQTYRFVQINPSEFEDPITVAAGSVILDYGVSGNGIIERTALGDNAPFDRIFTWFDRPWRTDLYELRSQVGILDGITDVAFGTVEGAGIYTDNGYFRGQVIITGGTSPDNAATRQFVNDSITDATGNVIIRSATEPTTRPLGSPLEVGDLWIDTSDGDRPYSWNGSAWVEAITIIDGGNISTGTVAAARIDVDGIFAQTLTLNDGGDIRSENFSAGSAGFRIRSNGDVEFNEGTFRGDLAAAGGTFAGDLSAVGGTFTGNLSAVGGTFSGSLSAVDGTFTGTLDGVDGTFSGELQAVTGSFGAVNIGGTLQMSGGDIRGAGDSYRITDQNIELRGATPALQFAASDGTGGGDIVGSNDGENITFTGGPGLLTVQGGGALSLLNIRRQTHLFTTASLPGAETPFNNYKPSSNPERSWWRLGPTASVSITGVDHPDGDLIITNLSTSDSITIANDSGSSAATMRILTNTGSNVDILPLRSAHLRKDTTVNRWRVLFIN